VQLKRKGWVAGWLGGWIPQSCIILARAPVAPLGGRGEEERRGFYSNIAETRFCSFNFHFLQLFLFFFLSFFYFVPFKDREKWTRQARQ